MSRLRIRSRWLPAALAVLAMGAVVVCPRPAHADDGAPGAAAREVHRRGHYPEDLMVLPPSGTGRGRLGGVPVFGERVDQPRAEVDPPDLGWLERLLRWLGGLFERLGVSSALGYAALAVGLVTLVAFFGYLLSRMRFRLPHAAEGTSGPDVVARPPLDPLLAMPELSPEELAAAGRFREAVHALFVRSLLAIGYTPQGRARSRTAREIVSAVDAGDRRKPPLADLLSLTELVWFGGREATRETYERAVGLSSAVAGPEAP